MSVRTIAPIHYQTPIANEIKGVAKQVGINKYSTSLVEDISNIFSGGVFSSSENVRGFVEENIQLDLKPDSDGDFRCHKNYSKSYTKDINEAKQSYIEAELKYHQNIQEFIKQLDVNKFKGSSSLEKALNCIKMLSSKIESDSGSDSNGDNIIPIFQDEDGKGLAQELHEAIDLVEKLDREDKELLELSDSDEENVSRLMRDELVKIILEVSSSMDKFTQIKTKPSSKLKLNPEGDIKQSRAIRDFSEIKKLAKKELINSKQSLAMKIINHEANVIEKYEREFKIPFVNLICDDSGSMTSNSKNKKAIGIIYNILKRVMREECWLSFSFFEEHCHRFYLLSVHDDIKEFFNKEIKKHRFNNGGTDVKTCISESLKEFEEICANNPEISSKDRHLIVINDGEDDCSGLNASELKGCKLHGFILDSSNQDIKRVCSATQGVYKERI